ncbi:MAG: HYR domain-containing protein [Saprospiraceae bacterium]|nr:HYR domain-containing protein [Saprospiraceae bacterium]
MRSPYLTTTLASTDDNCGTVTVTQSPEAGSTQTVVDGQTVTVTLTADDGNGNTANCDVTITVEDNAPPMITCPDGGTLNPAANCEITIPDYTALATTDDNCGTVTVTQSPEAGSTQTVVDGQTVTVTLTADDGNGNTANCDVTITIEDNAPPMIACPDGGTLNPAANCEIIIPDYTTLATTDDNCGTVTVTQSPEAGSTQTVVDGQTVTVTLTADDGNGNTANCDVTITVEDNTAPIAICQNIEINLEGDAGTASITAEQIDNGSYDNCESVTLSLDVTEFDCSHVGQQVVTLTVTDEAGNSSTCQATVTVNESPACVDPYADCTPIMFVNAAFLANDPHQMLLEPE